jgi:hypothetical protein
VKGRCEAALIAPEVLSFDLEVVAVIVEKRGAPGVGNVEAVEAGSFLPVLSRGQGSKLVVAWQDLEAQGGVPALRPGLRRPADGTGGPHNQPYGGVDTVTVRVL